MAEASLFSRPPSAIPMVYLERIETDTAWTTVEVNRLVGSLTRRRLITAAGAAALLRGLPAEAQSPTS